MLRQSCCRSLLVNLFLHCFLHCFGKIATPASEIDGEGARGDLEAIPTPMDTDTAVGAAANASQGGALIPDELQKQNSDTDAGPEPGQLEADAEVEAGTVDGETDAEVDLDTIG